MDVGCDGEQPRVSFHAYVALRMEGFGGEGHRPTPREFVEFPGFAKLFQQRNTTRAKNFNAPQAIAQVSYEDLSSAEAECRLYLSALADRADGFAESFMTAASPGIVATTCMNNFYPSHEDYVLALGRELKKEYECIAAHGLVLQIDAPDLAMERTWLFGDRSDAEFLEIVRLHVEAVNIAVADIPREQVRLHVCWGNYGGPHVHDIELERILPLLYEAKVGGLYIAFGNPRHEHEHAVFRKHPLPDGMILVAGVIDTTTNYVEHPQVVANRIEAVARSVGDPERVLAGTDCGFGTLADYVNVAEDVVWPKLQALREGAELASGRFWKG